MLLSIAYDGRPFSGFAPQPGRRTVAGELLGALRAIDPRIAEVRGASRTDAGVHALDQRVAFDPTREYPLRAWVDGAGKHLPETIAIRAARYVPRGYTPRFESVSKTYRYALLVDSRPDPFHVGRAWRVPELARDGALERARVEAEFAVGTHDFAAFRGSLDARENTVRTVHACRVDVAPHDPRLVVVEVRGSAFLYNMVRILVGALVDVGRGRLAPGAIVRALASKQRRDLGITAPPDGLVLARYTLRGLDEPDDEPAR